MNNGTTQYVTSFHYNFWSEQVCHYLLFCCQNIYFLVKFLYYIPDGNKYKRKTERVSFYIGEKKTLHENTHTGFYSLASLFICYR